MKAPSLVWSGVCVGVKRTTLQNMLATFGPDEDDSMPPSVGGGGPGSGANYRAPPYNDLDDMVIGGERHNISVSASGGPGGDDEVDNVLGLGELADLTVNNDAADMISYDLSLAKEAFRKTWIAKYTLRSHFDSVRALAFHPIEPVLITASEDHTLKLWNLQKTVPAKKTASLDVQPIYTFRGHSSVVLSLVIDKTGDQCYSAGLDGTIKCWNIPSSNIDPYDSFDPSVLQCSIDDAHSDAIWSLALHRNKHQLLSCSADGTVKLCHSRPPDDDRPALVHTYTDTTVHGTPSSVDFLYSDSSQIVATYSSGESSIFDLETGDIVTRLDMNTTSSEPSSSSDGSPITGTGGGSGGGGYINHVICHPTLPMTVTAHEDRHIKFFDNNSGKLIHSMVAHLDAVTSLAVDPNGLYLLSGSHDCSIRLWNLDSKTCVQEITSHRKKFDDSIYDVAFHPSKPYIASAGADALAKVFV